MKYNIGDIIIWKYERQELSTIVKIYYDWDGTTMYQLESWIRYPVEQYIKESYQQEELDKFNRTKIIEHIPIKI